MASLLTNKGTKKNALSQISNSNKNIFMKKDENKKNDEIIYHNDLHEKILLRKNALLTNTSVKKMKQIKKISINDNESKFLITKSTKKLDSSNKENHGINNKEKNDLKKSAKKKILKNIEDSAKFRLKESFPKKVNKNIKTKESIKNKNQLSILLNNSDNISKIKAYQKKEEEKNNNKSPIKKNFTKNQHKVKKEKEKNKEEEKEIENNSLLVSQNISSIIKNEKEDIFENSLKSGDIEYTLKYERKNMSEQKIRFQGEGKVGNIIPLMKMKKDHIKYSLKKKKVKANISIKSKKLEYEDDFDNSYLKKYNSINNEKETNRSYIDIINNFDIINIINKKEETKKLSSSIQKNSLNHTQELSQKRILKPNNSISINQINKKIINVLTNSVRSCEKMNENVSKEKEKGKEKSYGSKTRRKKYPENNNFHLLNTEKKNKNKSFINNNGMQNQNKWDKKYFIPIVSASLLGGACEDKEKDKEKNKYFKKINTDNRLLKVYMTNNKKSINFGDNNKKKREMLFNFSNKKLKNENYSYINFHTKRTNSFISKRNKHITERNNSINNMKKENYISNIDNDLDLQEKKLELIRSEISQEKIKDKLNQTSKYAISVDDICQNSFDKKKIEEIVEMQGNKINHKKYKTFHIKVNSLNKLKKSNNIKNKDNNNDKINDIMVIKRGDLLNRLRNIKHNYSIMEN